MGKPRILLIEDNSDDEILTMRALDAAAIKADIDVVHDGAEALDYLLGRGPCRDRDRHVLPQLILLDLKLPKIDGLQVVRQVKETEATRLIPIVVLTTSDENTDICRSYQYGANSYVRKPVDFNRFQEAIRQISRYWLQLNEAPRARG